MIMDEAASIRPTPTYHLAVTEQAAPTLGASARVRRRVASFLHRARTTRDEAIVDGIARVAPTSPASMLDIGCSDGRIAARVAARLGVPTVNGADVELQPDARIDVTVYDGRTLPFDDRSFDLVTIVDVLHHAEDPAVVLTEARRVLRDGGAVVVKDHVRHGVWSDQVLLRMDTASNFGVHEVTRGRYLSMSEWVALVARCEGVIEDLEWPFRVHPLPWHLVARDSYHLLFAVRPIR
jgi:SAM-dependent methyltransferase